MPFAATINANALGAGQGFAIVDSAQALPNQSLTLVGDVNGDGLADYVIGAAETGFGGANAGALYVVFGTGATQTGAFDLATLDGTNGFRLDGVEGERLGYSVAAAGDVNGDGFADVLAFSAEESGSNTGYGRTYLLFGGPTFNASLDLTSLDGSDGVVIEGRSTDEDAVMHIAAAGDVNGDGVDDFIISEQDVSVGGNDSGAAYVVFGDEDGLPAQIDLTALDGTNGFTFTGTNYSAVGLEVAAAGDLNGDGIDDIVVGRQQYSGYQATVYVLYGSTQGFDATLNIADIDGINGFTIVSDPDDEYFGATLQSLGDINGDGYDELAISAPYADDIGVVYVVFGSASGFDPSLNVTDLDGTNGFKLISSTPYGFGVGLAGGGDINGDGLGDLVVSAVYVDPYVDRGGEVYAFLGHRGPYAAVIDIATAEGGFRFVGPSGGYVGDSVSMAGDLNGDGLDDVMISTRWAQTAYVVYGQPDAVRTLAGGAATDRLYGGGADDTLSGLAGQDVLYGATGEDSLDGGDNSDWLYGEAGDDTLLGGLGGDVLDGGDGADELDGGDGADKLYGGAGADDLIGGGANDRFDGGADVDTLNGGDGNDYLDGGAGADTMFGGLGNDVFVVETVGDMAIEAPGGGYDIVRTALGGLTLAANIEALELQGSADIAGSGNAEANNLQGNSGSNTLFGNGGVDTINGNDGDDFIVGGAGNDLLRGGLGADSFVVGAESAGGGLETDQVYDFSAAEGDIIDLSGLYAGTLQVVSGFSKQAGQMTLAFAGGVTTVRVDLNGDGKVDYQMKVNGDVTGESGDWLL